MRYRVEISANAVAEAEEAFLWIYRSSPEQAVRWFTGLLDAVASLQRLPARCPLAPETDAFEEEIRQLLFGRRGGVYRILFTVVGQSVRVIHIRHGARKLLGA